MCPLPILPSPHPTPSPDSSQRLPPPQDATHFISFKGKKNTYIYLFEETEDLGISSKVSTLKTATAEMQKAKETPPLFNNGFLFLRQVE